MASARTQSEVKALLELGRKVISAIREGAPDALDTLEEYVRHFSAWESTWKVSRKGTKEVPARELEVAKQLSNQHAQIMRLTEEMQTQIEESLKTLRVKGKGIKAYIDQLPQRISTIKTKKG